MPERHVVRFAVGSPKGPRSAVWRLWTSGSDVYIAARTLGGVVKVSLHESRKWRFAFTEEYSERESSLLPSDGDRVIEKWERPTALISGLTSAFMIVVPSDELTEPRIDPLPASAQKIYTGGVKWFPPAPRGFATCFTVLFATPDHPPPSAETEFVLRVELPNREMVAVMVQEHRVSKDDEDQMIRARQAMVSALAQRDQDVGDQVLAEAIHPRMWLYGHNEYGTRVFADVSGLA